MDRSLTERDERYQVKGVLHIASFETIEQARTCLIYCWTKLAIERHLIQRECGAAIYDKHDSQRPILTVARPISWTRIAAMNALKIADGVPGAVESSGNQNAF